MKEKCKPARLVQLPGLPGLCSSCRWWDSTPFDARYLGLCRRNPPSIKARWDDEPVERDSWPETTPVDWCGEYAARGKDGGR